MPVTEASVAPLDTHNRELVRNVRPADWTNPTPAGRYSLVAIGAGAAGLISSLSVSVVGGRSALVERHLLGGDCLNVGCVPSKALLRAAHAAHEVRNAGAYGVRVEGFRVDFPAVMERLRRLRAQISPADSADRYQNEFGVDVHLGDARFVEPGKIDVDGKVLDYSRAVIATGGRAAAPPIPGLADAGYLTNETLFSLTELPRRFAVLGGGPIGAEMAQAFARFGAEVALIEKREHILSRDDADAAALVQRSMAADGVKLLLKTGVSEVRNGPGGKVLVLESDAGQSELEVDAILVAAGRKPNVEGLGLENVGVAYNERGIAVDEFLRTSNPRVFAAGDVAGLHQFTHIADAHAKIVAQNAFFRLPGLGGARHSGLIVPYATYTDPEVAHVGLYPEQAAERGIETRTVYQPLEHNDRAILEGANEGFVKFYLKKGTDRIVGATLVSKHAGETIGQVTTAMAAKKGLGFFSGVIVPYPTQAEVLKRAAGVLRKEGFTPLKRRILGTIVRWQT